MTYCNQNVAHDNISLQINKCNYEIMFQSKVELENDF